MSTKKRIYRGIASVLLLFVACFGLRRILDGSHEPEKSITIMVFNTVCKVTVYGDVKADKAFQEIIEKMARKVIIGTRLLNDVVNDGQIIVRVSRLSA
jgi:hypothetical protein